MCLTAIECRTWPQQTMKLAWTSGHMCACCFLCVSGPNVSWTCQVPPFRTTGTNVHATNCFIQLGKASRQPRSKQDCVRVGVAGHWNTLFANQCLQLLMHYSIHSLCSNYRDWFQSRAAVDELVNDSCLFDAKCCKEFQNCWLRIGL